MRNKMLPFVLLLGLCLPALAQTGEGVTRPRVAVVLSGGSALGIAHVGALEVIEDVGIPIDMIVGTSMGSVVGGLYSSGYAPEEMAAIVGSIDWNAIFSEKRDSPGDRYDRLKRERFSLRMGFDKEGITLGPSLLEGQNVLTKFTTLTLHELTVRDFDQLPVPYRSVAADIQNGEKVVFSTGSIAEAMRSSMSIPGIFRPYETGGRHLVDGGVVDNLPVDVAKGMGADIIIAVESRGQNPRSVDSLKSSFQITAQTMNLFIQNNMKEARKDADLLIKPDLSGYNTASYADAKRLIELGAAGAEAARPLLEALAARIAKERPLVKPEDQANRRAYHAPPTLIDMRIEGSTQEMRAQARAAFAPLLGRTLDRGALQRAIDSVYAIGQCSLVKFDLEAASGGEGAMGILTLVPDTTAENAFLLSTKFRALFTTIDENKTESLPALVLRDLSGKDSALFAEVGFQDRKRFYAEYFQPFGPFFVMPFFKYESVFDAYQFSRSQLYWTRYQSLGGGGWMGLTFSKASDFLVGYSFSNESAYDFGDTAPKVQLATLSGAFRLDTREGSVFPASGLSLLLHGRWADPRLGGASTFTQSDLEFTGAIPLGKNLTFGVAGFAGTDFAGILPVKGGLSSERYYTVKHPGMFYGMEERPSAATGDNVAALGLELRAKVGRVNALFGGDVIVLANFSLAGVQRAAKYAGDPTAFDFLPLSWNAAAGLGLRITPHFGLLLEGGVVDDGNPTIGPRRLAVSIELGSFSEFFEDQR